MCNGGPSLYWAISGAMVLPIVPWCLTEHRKNQRKTPSPKPLYILSIALYIFTIFASIGSFFVGILACHDQGMIYQIARYLYTVGWTAGSFCLIGILYAKVYYVFGGTVYALSKCANYSFIIIYGIHLLNTFLGFITIIINMKLFTLNLIFGLILILFLVNYLSFLFIYKLAHVSKITQPSIPSNHSSSGPTLSSSNSSEHSVNSQKSAKFNIVITKCTVLTICSLVSTWILFCCSIFMSINLKNDNEYSLFSVWYFSLGMDINTNFLCAMLSNKFAEKYYYKILGPIDRCFHMKIQQNINPDLSSQQSIETIVDSS
eukprot:72113_1